MEKFDINNNFNKEISEYFRTMNSIDDLLNLINYVNKLIFKENTKPLELKYLTYNAYFKENKYKTFAIPKKRGGYREICAPQKALKNILNSINIILNSVYTPQKACHGFTKNKSIITNAKNHISKNYVYNIDLEDFFTNIHQARIWKKLQLPPFNLKDTKIEIANLLSGLICYQGNDSNYLPQGAPTSPILSNIICERLDRRLLGVAKRFNVKYSRYADDLTFSSNHNVYQDGSDFITELKKIIYNENFKINDKKTRLQKKGYRQEVTGIIVNDKLNVRRKFIQELRFDIYLVERYGFEKANELYKNRYKDNSLYLSKTLSKVIAGKLDYLKMVKGATDNTYLKLKDRFRICLNLSPEKNSKEDKKLFFLEKNKYTKKTNTHKPNELVEILSSFSRNDILKYTTHNWDFGDDENKKDYGKFIENVRLEWKKLEKRLTPIAPKLSTKIYNFLLEETLGIHDKRWGIYDVQIGWSSPVIKKWSNETKLPFSYLLEDKDKLMVDNKSIDRFSDVIDLFKNEIEIRNEQKQLKKLLRNIKKNILPNSFSLKLINLDNVNFYTDVQWLIKGIRIIFEEIKRRNKNKEIEIEAINYTENNFIEISIIHKGSLPNRTINEMKNQVLGGGFQDIREAFLSLCDWRVEAKFDDGNYSISYLSASPDVEIKELDIEPLGFTHILRFYK